MNPSGASAFHQPFDNRDAEWRPKEDDHTSLEALDSEEESVGGRLSPRLRQRRHPNPSPPSEPHPQPASFNRKKKKRRRKWPPPILALEFQRTSPADTMAWLVLRLQDPLEEGGVEAYVRIVPPVKDMGTTLLLSCSTELVMKVARMNRMSVWQPKFSGPFRDECDSCKSGSVDSGLVTSEKQRLFALSLHQMLALEGEATEGIPGREQVEMEAGDPILSHLVQTGVASRLYPLHEPGKLVILNKMNWAIAFIDDKNWDGVREYFGIPVGIHFLFCSMVTRAAIAMSVMGFAGLGFAWIWHSPRGHLGVVAMANIIFAALFPKFWRQRCSDVASKWGMPRWDEPAPQPNRRWDRNLGCTNAPPLDREQDYPRWKRMAWAAALTIPSLFFILLLSMMMQLNYLNLQENHRWWEKNDTIGGPTKNKPDPPLDPFSGTDSTNETMTKDDYYPVGHPINVVVKYLTQGEPLGHWIGFRIMMVIYASFVVLMGYVVKRVVNITTAWESHKTIEMHERVRIFKLTSALFAVNFLPLYTTLTTQRNLRRVNELLLYVTFLDLLVCLIKRYFVCTWVNYCVCILRDEKDSSTHSKKESGSNFMVGLRNSLSGRSPRCAIERHQRSISATPSDSSSSSSLSPSPSPRAGESHTCRPPSPPPSIPALHKCLPPPPEDVVTAPPIRSPQGNVGQWVTAVGRAEQRLWEARADPALLPFEGWFDDHDEVLMRFSRAFLFPVLYLPLTVVSVVGCMVMLDADGKLLCNALQRPIVTVERGLGQSWQVALEVISWMILISNASILYFSFADKGKGIQQVSWALTLAVALVMAVFIKLIVMYMLPDCPTPPPSPHHPIKPSILQDQTPRITCRRRPFPIE